MAQVPGSFASVTLFLLVPKLWTRKGPKSGMTYLIIGILKNSCEPVLGFPGGSDGKDSACNAGNPVSISGLGRSPGEGNGNPLQYSCLENPMDRGAQQAIVHGIARVGHDLMLSFQVATKQQDGYGKELFILLLGVTIET